MWFNKKSKEKLQAELNQQTSKGCINSMTNWWNSLSKSEQAMAIGLVVAIASTPFIVMWASKITVVKVTAGAVNAAGTQSTIVMSKVAAPLIAKLMWGTIAVASVGFTASIVAASFNGATAEEYIKENV